MYDTDDIMYDTEEEKPVEKPVKKDRLMILSILLLFASFIAHWYADHLICTLFIFAIPIYLFLFIFFVALLISSIRRYVKYKLQSDLISIAFLVLLATLVVFFPFRRAKVDFELDRFEADRLEIVEMIKNHQLEPYEGRNIKLPAGYRKLSSDGNVCVYQSDENGQVIGFWVFRGMLSGSVELLYSTGGEALIKANETGHPITLIEPLKENWYYVETDY